MSGWFGKSWGAPCCEPEEHFATPVREPCLYCGELILAGDQGLLMPIVNPDERSARVAAAHLDCYLKRILPHGPDCPHCRGKERDEHALRCEYRQSGGDCNCIGLEEV